MVVVVEEEDEEDIRRMCVRARVVDVRLGVKKRDVVVAAAVVRRWRKERVGVIIMLMRLLAFFSGWLPLLLFFEGGGVVGRSMSPLSFQGVHHLGSPMTRLGQGAPRNSGGSKLDPPPQ